MRTPRGNEYNLRLIQLPLTIYGIVVLLNDDTYDVFINSAISSDMQEKALLHEITHIDSGHLYNDVDTVVFMEQEASTKAPLPPDRVVGLPLP